MPEVTTVDPSTGRPLATYPAADAAAVLEVLAAVHAAGPAWAARPVGDRARIVRAMGVQLRGRLGAIRDGVAMFSGGLRNHCALADQKLGRLLDDIDEWIDTAGISGIGERERFEPTHVPKGNPVTLDLNGGEIGALVWATGFQPDLSWVDPSLLDGCGRLNHDGGVCDAPGIYMLGSTFLRRRRSSFIHGATADSADLADHLVGRLSG